MPPKIFCFTNQKGGVGKSTSTANVAGALSELSKKVLLIDLDPQAGLTHSLGFDPNKFEKTIYHALLQPKTNPLRSVLVETKLPGVYLAPANKDLAAAEKELWGEPDWNRALQRALEPLIGSFNYILIDCPPSLGLLTSNALTACQYAIIPLQPEYLALRGLKMVQDLIEKFQANSNPKLKFRILVTMYDKRTLHSQEVVGELQSIFPNDVFKQNINRTIRFADSTLAGLPLVISDPKSEGAQAYRELVKELINL